MGRIFSGTRPAPNGTGLNFIKRVWEWFKKPRASSSIAQPRPALVIYKINPAWVFLDSSSEHTFALLLFHRSGYGSFLSPETKEH